MTQKYIALLLLPLMSGCTLLGGPDDFSGMYEAHVSAELSSLRELAADIGIGQKYAADGSMKFSGSVPGVASGILSTDYTSKVDGKNIEFQAKNLLLAYEALIASGSVSLDGLGIISYAGDTFFRLDGLRQTNMLSPMMVAVFEQYNQKWLSLTKEDMQNALSGASTEDVLSYQISESLSSLTLTEIEEYLVEYPILQETKDLGMSGSLHMYEVMLDTPSITTLVDTLSERITGSGLTSDEREALSKTLSSIQSSGVIGFDPKDASVIALQLSLTPPDSETLQLSLSNDKKSSTFTVMTGVNSISFSTEKTDDGRNTVLSMNQGALEVAKVIANTKYTKADTLSELQMTLSSPAQGITVTLLHKNKEDGTFEGDMNFGVGNTSWTGSSRDGTLSALHLKGAMPGQSFSADLVTTEGDMMRGPVSVKSGGAEIFAADLGLRITPERFSFLFDMALPVDETDGMSVPSMHFDGDIIAKRSDFRGSIDTPSDTTPLQELIESLDALTPVETFSEEDIMLDNTGAFVMPTELTESVQN